MIGVISAKYLIEYRADVANTKDMEEKSHLARLDEQVKKSLNKNYMFSVEFRRTEDSKYPIYFNRKYITGCTENIDVAGYFDSNGSIRIESLNETQMNQ